MKDLELRLQHKNENAGTGTQQTNGERQWSRPQATDARRGVSGTRARVLPVLRSE